MAWRRSELRRFVNWEDALADYVSEQDDRRFFRQFYDASHYYLLRNALIKANVTHAKRGNPPFLKLDPYIIVFEEGDDVSRRDWQFARDLVLIRMVERLYEKGWLAQNEELISQLAVEETEAEEIQ